MKQLLRALDQYAKDLKSVSVWKSSRQILGNVKQGKDDFIYEFYCYIRIIVDLKSNYNLNYCAGNGIKKNMFPKKPCDKKGRPYFTLLDKKGKGIYQICAGSKIKVKHGNKYDAPDISFQSANATDSPTFSETKLIMDAKYCNVSKGQYNDFAMMINNLNTVNAENEKLIFKELSGIKGNCLISFGETYTQDLDYIKSHHISAIEHFNQKNKFKIITY